MMAPNWANRRRAHDGVRFIWESKSWEINPFWVRPAYRDRDHFRKFDGTNLDQQLYGIFLTYTQTENNKLDLYWLAYDLADRWWGALRYDRRACIRQS